MTTIEDIKDKIRQLLIERDGDIQPYELKNIIQEAKQLGVDDKFIAKLVPDIDRTINWELIRAQKNKEAERILRLQDEIKIQEEQVQTAPEFIDALIQYCLADGMAKAEELNLIFLKAVELKQDSNAIARKVKNVLDTNNYKPYPTPDLSGDTLKDTLLSTNWYDEKHYLKLTAIPLSPPPSGLFPWKTVFGYGIPILVLIGLVYMANTRSSSASNTSTEDSKKELSPTTLPADQNNTYQNIPTTTKYDNPSSSSNNLTDTTVVQEQLIESTPDQTLSFTEEDIKNTLREFYEAENSRDVEKVVSYYSNKMTKYYDLQNPTLDDISKRYVSSWSVSTNSRNTIKNIDVNKVDNIISAVVLLDYSFFRLKTQQDHLKENIQMSFVFDENGKIVSIYTL